MASPTRTSSFAFLCASLLALVAACANDLTSPLLGRAGSAAAARASSSQSLSAATQSTTQIALNWNDPVRNETGWEIQRSTAGSGGPFTVRTTLGASNLSYVDNGLTPGAEYCYRVRSYRTAGKNTTYTEFSNVVCPRTLGPPPPVTGVHAVATGYSSASVVWDFNYSVTVYRIERASDPAAATWQQLTEIWMTIPGNYLDYGIRAGVRACYRVLAVNNYGASGPSNIACIVPPVPPATVTATVNGTSVDISWTDASGLATSYEISRPGREPIATVSASTRSYHDAGPLPDGQYIYWVNARSSDGLSDRTYSNSVIIATTAPSAPMVDVVSNGSTSVQVNWWQTAGVSETVRAQRSSDGVSGWTDIFTGNIWLGQTTDVDRATEISVCYRAFARNSVGESGPSNVDCTIPLARATDFRMTYDANAGEVTATWTDNSQHEEGYLVSVWSCDWEGYCDWSYAFAVGANVTSITLSGYDAIGDVLAYGDGYSDSAVPAADATATLRASPVRISVQSARTRESAARFSATHSKNRRMKP
jgi:hypothetical protein